MFAVEDSIDEQTPVPVDMPLPSEMLQFLWMHVDPTRQPINKVAYPIDYMSTQSDINPQMRHILVDWMITVGAQLNFHADTVHVACWYLDRFLSRRRVNQSIFQLVGTTALMIAAKTEEMIPISIDDFVTISDKVCKASRLREMELVILNGLEYSMGYHTLFPFGYLQFREYFTCPLRLAFTDYLWDESLTKYKLVQCNKMTVYVACVLVAKLLVRKKQFPHRHLVYGACWKKHSMSKLNWNHVRKIPRDFVSNQKTQTYYPLIKYGLLIPGPTTCCTCCHHNVICKS